MSGNEFFIILTAVCYFLFFSLFIYVDNFSLTFFSTKNIKLLTPFAFLSCCLCEKFYFSTFFQPTYYFLIFKHLPLNKTIFHKT